MKNLGEAVQRDVSSWAGVETRPHRFGEVEFRVRGYEIGHLHGSLIADLPFPVRMRKGLVAEGKAEPHHLFPQTGWVSHYPRSPEDIPAVVYLFRLNYEHLVQRGEKKAEKLTAQATTTGEETR